mgnify:CR=1 FL=1
MGFTYVCSTGVEMQIADEDIELFMFQADV